MARIKMGTLKELKAKTLQDIASSCGLLKSGNKAQVYQRIRAAAQHFKPLPSKVRILSIDMGIRNMAYCILRPGEPPSVKSRKSKGEDNGRKPSVQVETWRRLALDLRDSHNTTTAAAVGESQAKSTEDFSPAQMAKMALSFVQSHILPAEPTHILIERQRYRSSNSPAITDWTIRVNSLEAMLYSMLAVYKSLGKFQSEVIPVAPRSVATFLLDENTFTAGLIRQGRTPEEQELKMDTSKKNKVDLLGRLIRHEDALVEFHGYLAGQIAAAFKARGSGSTSVKKATASDGDGEKAKSLAKVDDLADCLLQGIAWVEWQRNMDQLIKTQAWVTGPGEEPAEVAEIKDDVDKKRKRRTKMMKQTVAEETEVKTKRTRKRQGAKDLEAPEKPPPMKETRRKGKKQPE